MMNGKWGWFIQEIISPLMFGYFFITGDSIKTPEMWIFFILWVGHYFNRSIIFPLRQKDAKDTAVLVVSLAILFNIMKLINANMISIIILSDSQNLEQFYRTIYLSFFIFLDTSLPAYPH